MKPHEAYAKFNKSNEELEIEYFKDLTPWILEVKPGAEKFEFEGYQESDDEGGSNYYFRKLWIDGESFQELITSLPLEKVKDLVAVSSDYSDEKLEDKDILWDCIRDNLDFPEFIYERGEFYTKGLTFE